MLSADQFTYWMAGLILAGLLWTVGTLFFTPEARERRRRRRNHGRVVSKARRPAVQLSVRTR